MSGATLFEGVGAEQILDQVPIQVDWTAGRTARTLCPGRRGRSGRRTLGRDCRRLPDEAARHNSQARVTWPGKAQSKMLNK